ncbi:ComEA family DNA-binding protein [Pyramidobacter piscolens]|uniref:ComEA family DNA-binding protein n=1 Tax=Pyramidobacter piscolens TaxID=638849 RepID=UPI0026655F5D|nr:ComEA family DNA-binding protein [Pyramidobacter piscolens]
MENRTKISLCVAGAIFCIGCAGAAVRIFRGSWQDEAPTAVAGPALWLQSPSYKLPASSSPEHYAYITGAVSRPGVYPISADARVFQLVEAAGGFRFDADQSQVNLAAPIRDGAHVHVKAAALTPQTSAKSASSQDRKRDNKTQYVYVNTATEEDLCALPGVGPATARKIIEYRQTHGPFHSAEALLEVSGIGKGKLGHMQTLLRF